MMTITAKNPSSSNRRRELFILLAAFLVTLCGTFGALPPAPAFALQDSEELVRIGDVGVQAGEIEAIESVATEPTTGHIFAAQAGFTAANNRINEFTPWGTFVKAIGWNVAPGSVNEYQEARIAGTEGAYTLSLGAGTTQAIPFNAGAPEVQAALEALSTVGAGNVSVSEVPGTLNGRTPYILRITFIGSKSGIDIEQLTIATSGGSALDVETRTLANGAPAGVGLETCTTESGCRAAETGSKPGQIGFGPLEVAVGPNEDLYLRETGENSRVQKFSPDGRFLLMFGPEVNKTTGGDVCTAADVVANDVCGAGVPGSGPGEFGQSGPGIAVIESGSVVLAEGDRLLKYSPSGSFESEVTIPGAVFTGLGANPQTGGFYAADKAYAVDKALGAIRLFDPSLVEQSNCPSPEPQWVSGGSDGRFFASERHIDPKDNHRTDLIRESDSSSCALLATFGKGEATVVGGEHTNLEIEGLSLNAAGDLAVGYSKTNNHLAALRTFGPAPVSLEGPPPVPPTITLQFASSVQQTEATVGGFINPHFWADARYYVEYGQESCEEGGCSLKRPLPPGALLTSKVASSPVKTPAIALGDLTPGTTYHYRLVAQSGGGGPVVGVGGTVGSDGGESTFTTLAPLLGASTACPNQAFRTGFSAALPDCRALEMVSPVDKKGGDITNLLNSLNFNNALDQSAVDGQRFVYSSYRAFGEPEGAALTDQFLASRVAGSGWQSQSITPRQGINGAELYGVNANFDREYKAFSDDLCQGWVALATEPPLAPGATEGGPALYRRDNCADPGTYVTVAQGEEGAGVANGETEVQGISADGEVTVVRATSDLTHNGKGNGVPSNAYYVDKSGVKAICVLPSGVPWAGSCSAGTTSELGGSAGEGRLGRVGSVTNALSADGTKVFWTAVQNGNGTGQIYLRENPGEEQSTSGECDEAGKACTAPVSGTKSNLGARFLTATPDGSKAIYEFTEGTLKGNLYEFDVEAGASTLIAKRSLGLAGNGTDLANVYFASEEKIAGTTGSVSGKPNLYLDHEGEYTFIAILSPLDVAPSSGFGVPSNVSPVPVVHSARASADGQRLVFTSTESLTGYDNTDAASTLPCGAREGAVEGRCDSEVFSYAAGSAGPVCISCNPSGALPEGRIFSLSQAVGTLPAAAIIPLPTSQLHVPRVISASGDRIFFNALDALTPRDTNAKEDVYEWQPASNAAECAADGAEQYVESSQGCLSLISSGESPSDSEFLDASSDGSDAFFVTNASLLPQDPGLYDVYDARVNGGFPQPVPTAACEGEACQGPLSPPNDPTPASATFNGAGNVKEAEAKKRHKKKSRAKKAHKKTKSRKHNNRRAGR